LEIARAATADNRFARRLQESFSTSFFVFDLLLDIPAQHLKIGVRWVSTSHSLRWRAFFVDGVVRFLDQRRSPEIL